MASRPIGSKEYRPVRTGRLFRTGAVATVAALFLSACAGEDLPQNSLEPAGPIARDIDGLWNLVFWIAVVVFVLVEGALVYSIFRFRQRRGDERRARQIHGNTRLEVAWSIVPAVLLGVIAIPTVTTLLDFRSRPDRIDLEINVTGHQWWFEFEYPDLGIVTANELHIPAEKTVYLTMTSADVIHSFWVPKITGKRDLVPGRLSHLTLIADEPTPPGEPLFGQCAEFCGLAHADMRIKVFVDTEEEFAAWAASQVAPARIPTGGAAAAGWDTFNRVCVACHVVTAAGDDGVAVDFGTSLAPNLTHFAGRTTFAGATFRNDTEHLRAWLRDPPALKPMAPELNDASAGRILGMPDFDLDEDEIDGLIALLQGLE